jgi:two-component system, LytTR family, response regulator
MSIAGSSSRTAAKAGVTLIWLAVAVALWLAYSLVFVGTVQARLPSAMSSALANVAPLVLLAAIVMRGVRLGLMSRTAPVQILAHLVLAPVFSALWYAGTVLGLSFLALGAGHSFRLVWFEGPALTWQLFQGVILYAAVAAIGYAVAPRPPAARPSAGRAEAPPPLERYLIREGEDFRPVEVNDIVTITGAQDYSEVTTDQGRHLVRLSLAELESRLDPGRFVRVHRSTIIHLARLERAELAGGGRMLAHMSDGQRVPVSRTGVKALRPLIV